jgi:hypothetical protein
VLWGVLDLVVVSLTEGVSFRDMTRADRDTLVAAAVAVLLIIAMAIDHLVGTDPDEGEQTVLADPGAFVLAVLVSGVLHSSLLAARP